MVKFSPTKLFLRRVIAIFVFTVGVFHVYMQHEPSHLAFLIARLITRYSTRSALDTIRFTLLLARACIRVLYVWQARVPREGVRGKSYASVPRDLLVCVLYVER